MTETLLFYLTIALAISFVLTFGMTKIRLALDHPSDRSSHSTPTPRGGGFTALLSFIAFLYLTQGSLDFPATWGLTSPIVLSALALGIIGLLDDVFRLPAVPRLFAQASLATWVVLSHDLDIHLVLPEDTVIKDGYGQLLSIIWIVGFVNLFNFMDGLNGMVSLGAIVACLIVALTTPLLGFQGIALGIAVALLGFLPLNFPKARIFLGDSGSQAFGFLLACLLLTLHHESPKRFSVYLMALTFLPYLYDGAMTTLTRLFKGNNLLKPHREFIFHRLHIMGWNHKRVSLFYASLTLACGMGVYVFSSAYVLKQFVVMMVAMFGMTIIRAIVRTLDRKQQK